MRVGGGKPSEKVGRKVMDLTGKFSEGRQTAESEKKLFTHKPYPPRLGLFCYPLCSSVLKEKFDWTGRCEKRMERTEKKHEMVIHGIFILVVMVLCLISTVTFALT